MSVVSDGSRVGCGAAGGAGKSGPAGGKSGPAPRCRTSVGCVYFLLHSSEAGGPYCTGVGS